MSLYSRGWFIECDAQNSLECHDQFDPLNGDETTDPTEVEEEAKAAGWKVIALGGPHQHICPWCQEEP